jgi:hypothetical protein
VENIRKIEERCDVVARKNSMSGSQLYSGVTIVSDFVDCAKNEAIRYSDTYGILNFLHLGF